MKETIITRSEVSRIEMLQSLIDNKTDQAERILAKPCDPVRRSISRSDNHSPDPFKRSRMMTDCIDKANQIKNEIEPLRSELSELQSSVKKYIDNKQPKDFVTRSIINMRLIWACTWEEIAEMIGFSKKACQNKYDNWINTL